MLVIHNGIRRLNEYLPSTNHWLILLASIPVALASGTLFVYSVYGTQLAEKCHLNSTQASNLNISATIGTALGGCILGVITDYYGTQIPILASFLSLSIGYKLLHYEFNLGVDSSIGLLLFAMFLIGNGSVSGYFSSLKAVAIYFPNYKATAQSITIASFAISSLIFLFICSKIFKADVSRFLYFLFVSSGFMYLLGFIFIRIDGIIDQSPKPISSNQAEPEPIEEQPLLSIPSKPSSNLHDLSLKESLLHPIFWIHYLILSIIQGLGQMYIYGVGYVIKAIHFHYTHYHNDPSYQPSLIELQALHVSLIAITSFIGRLTLGPQADFLVNKLKYQRHWILILGLIIMLSGHFLLTLLTDLISENLYHVNILLSISSCLIGYAYGFSFTCYPSIISDLFNMQNYSFLWGVMYTSTTFGLTIMTKIFGIIYDSNSNQYDDNTHEYFCDKGSGCYNLTFKITSSFCLLAGFIILLYIFYRRTHT